MEWANLFKWGNPEIWRVVLPTPKDVDPEILLSDELIQKKLHSLLPRDEAYDVVYRSLYSVHQRIASTFRKGRAILAGDSAHVNSPIGAMGMNSGIHDAINLGEKLKEIISCGADHDLLDRYSRQRRHVAVNHTKMHTERNKKLLAEADPTVRARNHDRLRSIARDPEEARQFLLGTSLIQGVREAALIP